MLNHVGTREIETERLILRRFVMEDAELMFKNWANNPAVCAFLPWDPHGSIEVTREIIGKWLEEYDQPSNYHWIIVEKSLGEPVGSIGTNSLREKDESCVIGYCIAENCWGRGITTEATKAMLGYLFDEVGFHRIYAVHDVENPASGRVMEKSGMTYEGTERESRVRRDGTFGSMKVWSILRSEWGSL